MSYDSQLTLCQYLPLKDGFNIGYYTHFFLKKLTKLKQIIRFLEEQWRLDSYR